ncbi:GATA domain-containing protein [Cephalotus follicularis]|uniref:GATA transcription factor n=1 Tax=Cephalotus follicularis TaxID=3775 RepID=A0A1Q3CBT2_CEPFO|nr:GATA domain-containing protein [Cephalotus follicularis]
MEAPEFFMGGYFGAGAGISDQKTGENFAVDDLLDFSNDDAIMNDGFFDNETKNSGDSSTVTCNSSVSGVHENHFTNHVGCRSFADSSQFSSELCVPYDDVAELEWLSNFVEDSFSNNQNLHTNFHILTGSKPPTPESSSSSTQLEHVNRIPNNPIFDRETPLPVKARSKRSRAAPCDWSTRLLHVTPTKTATPKKRDHPNSDSSGRKCLHCASEKTPQWRTGPMGPKTLCNACGVRYKSGRLVPEYRPAASPTFVTTKHSNSHRKVLELRRQRELQRAHQQFLSQSSIFGLSNGGDEFLVQHRSGADFGHMI